MLELSCGFMVDEKRKASKLQTKESGKYLARYRQTEILFERRMDEQGVLLLEEGKSCGGEEEERERNATMECDGQKTLWPAISCDNQS